MNNLIGIYDNFMSDKDCDSIIEYFEKSDGRAPGKTAKGDGYVVNTSTKDSTDLILDFRDTKEVSLPVLKTLSKAVQYYVNTYPILYELSEWNIFYRYNIQKYAPGQAFHRPHCEHKKSSPELLLAWMIYLNDVDNGGETRFEYQDLNLNPTKGTAVIWPAYFTHVHYGLASKTETKYIVTGWHTYV